MKSEEALKILCSNCERHLSLSKQACPYRSISNDYCEEYKEIGKDLEKLSFYKTIVSVLLTKNDCITKIRYALDVRTMKIKLYIHFDNKVYCWFEFPYDDFKEVLEDDTPRT